MDQEKIGKFIAVRRKEKQLTQAQLAQKLGITDRAVSKWETGKSMPDASIMLALCDILGITVNELLSGEKIDVENYEKTADENLIALKRQDENNITQNRLLFMLFSAAMLTAILVCLICDAAISGSMTWASIPVCSILFAWALLAPAVLLGKRGILGSLLMLSVLIVPYLFILSRLVRVGEVLTLGMALTVPAAVFLWLAAALFCRMGKTDFPTALGITFLSIIPFILIINAILARTLHEPFWDVWDMLTICLLLLLAVCCFIWRYARKKALLKRGGKEPNKQE